MKNRKRLFALIATFALVFTLLIPGIAIGDAGSFSGSSSYGGSSSYSGGSSSSGSSGTYYGGSSSSGASYGIDDVAFGLIVVIIVFGIGYMVKRKGGNSDGSQPAGASITPGSELKPLSELLESDPDFDKKAVEERVSNIYVKMQNAWTAGDFEPVRPYFTNNLYAQFDRQLADMKRKGYTNYVENIAVLEVTARGWYESAGEECIVLKVRTRINDYIMDKDGNCVQGTPERELFMEYEYAIVRPKGTKTSTQDKAVDSKHCPNCGAPLDEAASARCPYCDSVITIDQHDWVVSSIKGISQQNA